MLKQGPVRHFSELWNVLDAGTFSLVLSYMFLHMLQLLTAATDDYDIASGVNYHLETHVFSIDVVLVEGVVLSHPCAEVVAT